MILAARPAWAADPAIGYNENLNNPGDAVSYDLFLPHAYRADAELPVLVVLGDHTREWTKTTIMEWAEQRGVAIYVMLPPPKINGRYAPRKFEVGMKECFAAIEQIKGISRVNHVCTYTAQWGFSSSIAAAMEFPQDITGIICAPYARFYPVDQKPSPWLAIAELHWTRARWAQTNPGPKIFNRFCLSDRRPLAELESAWLPHIRASRKRPIPCLMTTGARTCPFPASRCGLHSIFSSTASG